MLRRLRRFLRAAEGNAGIEFAFTAPVMILLIAGGYETGVIFSVYNATNRLATQYAIAWSDCSDSPVGACQSELLVYTAPAAIANIVPQLTATVTLQMFMVQMSGTTPTVVYAYPAAASLTPAQTTAAQAAFQSGQTGVVVTAKYQHSMMVFGTYMTPILGTKLQPTYTITQLKS